MHAAAKKGKAVGNGPVDRRALHSDERQIAQIPHRSWSADGWVCDVQARSGDSNLRRHSKSARHFRMWIC